MSSEFKTKQELQVKRAEIKSFDDLVSFIKDVDEHYNIGYGDAPRAIAQAALATAWYLSGRFGITGFQSGATLWDFIEDWSSVGKQTQCAKIIDYDNMLYPQYEYKFDKSIPPAAWKRIQEAAKSNLEEDAKHAHPDVVKHWKSIVAGKVPFGFYVRDEQ